MRFTVQRRLAASVLKCSPKKVWFDPANAEKVKEAITKADIRTLIISGLIQQKLDKPQSRGRARKRSTQRKKGRQKGLGRRKGKKTARTPRKETWMKKIRLQRSFLKMLKEAGTINNKTYRDTYLKAKGGFFRSKRHIKMFLDVNKLFTTKK